MSRWRASLHDFWLLYLAPWLPSWLPWGCAYRCYRAIARSPRMYPEPARAAMANAPACVPIDDVHAFARDVRTVWLLDAVDLALSRRHRRDWMPAHVTVRGRWPAGAFVAAGFHYGTGLWAFHDLRRNGRDAVFVAARFDRADFARHPWRYRYGVARVAEIERIGGEAVAFRPGVRPRLLDALARGVPFVSLVDTPPRHAPRGQRPLHLLGRPASLPDGSVLLAREAGVPIVPFWVEIDLQSGLRTLVIGEPIAAEPVDAALVALASILDRLIRAQPAAWLFWNEWPAWQQDAAALHGAHAAPDGADFP